MAISNTTLSTGNTLIFTATGDQMIATMIFCNTDASYSHSINVYLVPSGQSVGTSNMIINQLAIPAGDTVFFDTERLVLGTGDHIYATVSNGTSVVCTLSWVDI
jgi:hypothetical protein